MKLSFISLVLSAGLAISQVSAAPLRVIVVSGSEVAVGNAPPRYRVGHPAVDVKQLQPIPVYNSLAIASAEISEGPKRMGCLKHKAMQATNWLRVTAGLPPLDHNMSPGRVGPIMLKPDHEMTHDGHHHHLHHLHHQDVKFRIRYHSQAFIDRLTRALMMLGPWEGRAVAFVLGCGLGALLRMVWVLSILTLRAIRGRTQEEDVVNVVIFEEQEHLLPPPEYEAGQVPQDVKEKVEN